ncbi:MAG: RNA polymerase sigma factor, partial [Actinomycetota bacterium]
AIHPRRWAVCVSVRSLSDESLLAGLASSDPDGSAAFVRRFQGRVFGLAMTIVGDPNMAEEVAQESFMRAWRHAGTFDPTRGRVVTWLLAITRNVAIDALRMRRQVPVDPSVLIDLRADSHSDPEAQGVMADESDRVRRALADLPKEQRRAVLMSAFFGRTAREIGDIERIPLGTAKTRIRTGLQKLREAFEVTNDR